MVSLSNLAIGLGGIGQGLQNYQLQQQTLALNQIRQQLAQQQLQQYQTQQQAIPGIWHDYTALQPLIGGGGFPFAGLPQQTPPQAPATDPYAPPSTPGIGTDGTGQTQPTPLTAPPAGPWPQPPAAPSGDGYGGTGFALPSLPAATGTDAISGAAPPQFADTGMPGFASTVANLPATPQQLAAARALAPLLGPAGAAGMVGAMTTESGANLDPGARNPSGATGMGQWTGPRLAALLRSPDPSSFAGQLNFTGYELTGPEAATAARLRGMTDPRAASGVALTGYERPSPAEAASAAPRAAAAAQAVYDGIKSDFSQVISPQDQQLGRYGTQNTLAAMPNPLAAYGRIDIGGLARFIDQQNPDLPDAAKLEIFKNLYPMLSDQAKTAFAQNWDMFKFGTEEADKQRDFLLRQQEYNRPTFGQPENFTVTTADGKTQTVTGMAVTSGRGAGEVMVTDPGTGQMQPIQTLFPGAQIKRDPLGTGAFGQVFQGNDGKWYRVDPRGEVSELPLPAGAHKPTTARSAQGMWAQKWWAEHPAGSADQFSRASANYRYSQAVATAFGSGIVGRNLDSLNTVADHILRVKAYADALQTGNIQRANQIAQTVSRETGGPEVTTFEIGRDIMADEVVRLLTATGGTEADRQTMQSRIAAWSSPAQFAGVFNALVGLTGGRFRALELHYSGGDPARVKEFEQDHLTPDARAVFHSYQAATPDYSWLQQDPDAAAAGAGGATPGGGQGGAPPGAAAAPSGDTGLPPGLPPDLPPPPGGGAAPGGAQSTPQQTAPAPGGNIPTVTRQQYDSLPRGAKYRMPGSSTVFTKQ
jgi:type II secretory pathway pseudopilin PulG